MFESCRAHPNVSCGACSASSASGRAENPGVSAAQPSTPGGAPPAPDDRTDGPSAAEVEETSAQRVQGSGFHALVL